jgi:hypothetical protein
VSGLKNFPKYFQKILAFSKKHGKMRERWRVLHIFQKCARLASQFRIELRVRQQFKSRREAGGLASQTSGFAE